jgi:ABC-type nickel/cobalt efflux system permease component RcnA
MLPAMPVLQKALPGLAWAAAAAAAGVVASLLLLPAVFLLPAHTQQTQYQDDIQLKLKPEVFGACVGCRCCCEGLLRLADFSSSTCCQPQSADHHHHLLSYTPCCQHHHHHHPTAERQENRFEKLGAAQDWKAVCGMFEELGPDAER